MPKEQELQEGKIVAISAQTVHVEILLKEACQQCKSKSACMAFNTQERIIDITCYNPQDYQVGEIVDVKMDTVLGFKAVVYAYVLPMVLLLIVMVVGSHFLKHQLWVACWAVLAVVLYYLILYILRRKINQKFKFYIEKKSTGE